MKILSYCLAFGFMGVGSWLFSCLAFPGKHAQSEPDKDALIGEIHTTVPKDDFETVAQRAIHTYNEWRRLDDLARDEKTTLRRQQADAAFDEYLTANADFTEYLAADVAFRKEAAK